MESSSAHLVRWTLLEPLTPAHHRDTPSPSSPNGRSIDVRQYGVLLVIGTILVIAALNVASDYQTNTIRVGPSQHMMPKNDAYDVVSPGAIDAIVCLPQDLQPTEDTDGDWRQEDPIVKSISSSPRHEQ